MVVREPIPGLQTAGIDPGRRYLCNTNINKDYFPNVQIIFYFIIFCIQRSVSFSRYFGFIIPSLNIKNV